MGNSTSRERSVKQRPFFVSGTRAISKTLSITGLSVSDSSILIYVRILFFSYLRVLLTQTFFFKIDTWEEFRIV